MQTSAFNNQWNGLGVRPVNSSFDPSQNFKDFREKSSQNGKRLINGVPSAEWQAMSDSRRESFMREKRRGEAFKTEMCKGLKRTGFCRYGDQCRFAHREEELCVRPMHPKYKTELCRSYATRGTCVYGQRCQFIHRSPPIQYPNVSFVERRAGVNYIQEKDVKDLSSNDRWEPLFSRLLFTDSCGSLTSANDKNFSRSCFPVFPASVGAGKKDRMPAVENLLLTDCAL